MREEIPTERRSLLLKVNSKLYASPKKLMISIYYAEDLGIDGAKCKKCRLHQNAHRSAFLRRRLPPSIYAKWQRMAGRLTAQTAMDGVAGARRVHG